MATDQRTTFHNLRLASSSLVSGYLLARPQLLHTWQWIKPRKARKQRLPTDEVIFHSWLPGMLEVPKATGQLVRELIRGEATLETSERHRNVVQGLRELGWCEDTQVDVHALAVKARDIFPAVQNPEELRGFLDVAKQKRPKTVVEIGTAAGGLFYCLSQIADPHAMMISIDVEGGPYGGGQSSMDTLLFSNFGPPTQKFHFLRQRSFHLNTRQSLKKLLDGKEIDLLVIDGDHSYAGVKADFEMYGSLVAPDGMVAMHDVCEFPRHMTQWREGNDVNVFWKELKEKGYKTQEIICPYQATGFEDDGERLETRWPALGFGLVFGGFRTTEERSGKTLGSGETD